MRDVLDRRASLFPDVPRAVSRTIGFGGRLLLGLAVMQFWRMSVIEQSRSSVKRLRWARTTRRYAVLNARFRNRPINGLMVDIGRKQPSEDDAVDRAGSSESLVLQVIELLQVIERS